MKKSFDWPENRNLIWLVLKEFLVTSLILNSLGSEIWESPHLPVFYLRIVLIFLCSTHATSGANLEVLLAKVLVLLAMLIQARMSLTFLVTWAHAGSCSAVCQPAPPDPFLRSLFPATLPPACRDAQDCSDPRAGLGNWCYWTLYSWL